MPGAAQTPPPDAARQEFERLFDEVLRNPTDLDLSFRYAQAAAAVGDFEAAITALERMLYVDRNLPRVRLELGAAYFQLGSLAAARGQFDQVLETPDLPPEVRERVGLFIEQIERGQSRHRFSGQVGVGIQHQSNANVSPASATVRALGTDVTLSDQFTKKADQNVFTSGSLLYAYDLGTQTRDTLEATVAAFMAKYFRVHRLDLGFLEVTVGPRINPAFLAPQAFSVRPYAIGNAVQLGRNPYFHTLGGGVEVALLPIEGVRTRFAYEHRVKNFRDAADRPSSRALTGNEDGLNAGVTVAVTDNSLLDVALSWSKESTRQAFNSNRAAGIAASYRIGYPAPFGLTGQPWSSSASAARIYANYDAADPSIDPGVERFDRRWRLGLAQTIGIFGGVDLLVQAQRDVVSSTLPNFAYVNTSVLLGTQVRF